MSSPGLSFSPERLEAARDACNCQDDKKTGIHMSLLAWFQVVSIIVGALYFVINHDATTAVTLNNQQHSIESINSKMDNLDKKINDNADKLSEMNGKLDMMISRREQVR